MPQPKKECVVHVLGEDGKTKGIIQRATFPEIPQIGWTLIFDRVIKTAGIGTLTDIEGVVKKIIMFENSDQVIVFLKETKA